MSEFVSVEKAFEKICPFSVRVGGTQGCFGKDCMGWRAGYNSDGVKDFKQGYCGMAGKMGGE
ncbi:MAG: hypothetical protein HY884_05365 [Deltaproteobacteria bacterium]|nr:hypothetical protein [Deltaproteobacteria bacterium]